MSCKFLLQESYVFMGTLPIQYTTKYLVHCLEYNNEPIRGPGTVVDTVVGFNENFLVNDEELFSVLQKVPSEANPKVRNHGEGP